MPLALFSAANFPGTVTAPTVGGFIYQYTDWRWCFWVVLILGGTGYVATIVFLPETSHPKLITNKVCCNNNPDHDATVNRVTVQEQFYTNLIRP